MLSNLTCFKSVILNVYGGKFNNRNPTCRSTQSKRVRLEDDLGKDTAIGPLFLDIERKKRRKTCSLRLQFGATGSKMEQTVQ